MVEAHSPRRARQQGQFWRGHSGELAGYTNALRVAYAVEPLPAHLQRLLDDLEARERH